MTAESEENKNWFEQDSGAGMPNWTLVLLVILLVLFILLGFYISRTIRKNRAHRDAQE